jgi:hypothetical protein
MPDVIEWERRRPGEPTPQYLGRVLEWIGFLEDMPRRAREGHFDDFFAPPEIADGFELHRLVEELKHRKTNIPRISRLRTNAVITAVMEGEFDATKEESDRWAASKDGQETFRKLVEGE